MEQQLSTTAYKIKESFLHAAEIIDAFRLVPRIIVTMYGVLIYNLYMWFINISTAIKTQCDSVLIQALLNSGVDLVSAQRVACTAVEVIGGPTPAQAAFVTTVIGLATPMFMFYTNTGRKWSGGANNATAASTRSAEE